MRPLTCNATKRRLQSYYDEELSFSDQIAVDGHLEWCDHCAAALEELRETGQALRGLSAHRDNLLSYEESGVFTSALVNRLKVEEQASLFAWLRTMFEDMHLVYAGLGAAGATALCVVIMLGMMRFATAGRPDSLAAIVNVLATPLECESGNDLTDTSGCRARWAGRFQRANELANETAELDAVFELDNVVTQRHLTNLETLRSRGGPGGRRSAARQVELAMVVEGLLETVSRSRLEIASSSAANMIWMVEHATVRASKPPALDPPPAKKRAAVFAVETRRVLA
jgi:hypothetical protein